jgi:signal transduction histidine kinase
MKRISILRYFFIGYLLISSLILFGQISESKYDSLIQLAKSPIDTVRLNALKQLTWECRFSNQLKGFEYGFDGLAIAEKLEIGNDIAVLHNYIGVLAVKINSLDKAKIQLNMAYHIADSLNIVTEKAYALNNLGEVYNLTGNLDSAQFVLKEAIELFSTTNNLNGLAYTYNQLGLAMRSQKKFDEAIKYHSLVLEIREKLQSKPYITRALLNLGIDYLEMGSFADARKYFDKIDHAQLEMRAKFSVPYLLILIGKTYQGENDLKSAIKLYKQALDIADSAKLYSEMADAAKLLSDIYNISKDYKTALIYFNIYKSMNDSVKSSDLVAEYKQLEMKKEFDQKYKYLEYKMQQDIDNQKLKLYWNKILIYSFIAFMIILLILIIILIRNFKMIANKNKQLLNQKQDIENKNKAILTQHNELETANATKDKFFSILAHDLRGPIGNFYTFTNLLINAKETELSKKMMETALIINTSAQQTLTLLENLLTWARLQKGSIDFNPKQNNICAIFENNVDLLHAKANEKKLTVINNLPGEMLCELDYNMIDTVVRNLLSNAIKFTHQNGTITISGKMENNSAQLKLSDTGIGMSQSEIEQLFRIDVSHKSKDGTSGEKGSGLGLILCKEFIELHGGKLWVESELGKGSSFLFTLPCK